MTFGEKFKAEREKRGLTQQEVADALGLNRRMITRYEHDLSFPRYKDAYKKIADFFNDCARQANPKLAANLILGQIFRGMQTEEEKEAFGIKVTPSQLAELVKLQDEGKINAQIARQTLKKMLEEGKDASAYLTEDDLKGVDSGAIDKLCAEAVAANARAVNDYRNGKTQAIKALVGYVMKATRGKADAGEAEKKIIALIGG